MKIDFHGRFQEISRFLQTRQLSDEAPTSTQEFSRLLGDIKPDSSQPTDNTKTIPESAVQESEEVFVEKGPMARFTPTDSEMTNPPLKRLLAPGDDILVGERAEPRVKTPTILGAKRVDDAGKSAGIVKGAGNRGAQATEASGLRSQANMKEMLKSIAADQGVDPYLGIAVARAESSFNPRAVSSDGHFSKGLFQLLDNTARDVISRENLDVEYSPFEPAQNAEIGLRYLRHLHDLFSKESELPNNMSTYPAANSSSLEKLAVAAYNAGEGRVASAQDRAARAGYDPTSFESVRPYLPESTQEYVQRVIGFRSELESEYEG